MADSATFLLRFPEYKGAPIELVDETLVEAASSTNVPAYPTTAMADNALYLQAAILLADKPHGRKMAVSGEMIFGYRWRLQRAQRAGAMGLRTGSRPY
jgi:hypothetical protein